jgi:hypothetical protein
MLELRGSDQFKINILKDEIEEICEKMKLVHRNSVHSTLHMDNLGLNIRIFPYVSKCAIYCIKKENSDSNSQCCGHCH